VWEKGEGARRKVKGEGWMNRTDLAKKDQGSMFKKREQEREGRVDRMEVLGGLNDFPWWAGRLGLGKGLRTSDEDRGLGGTYLRLLR
jgi:hypothetical protein